jgi:hypothetical protein
MAYIPVIPLARNSAITGASARARASACATHTRLPAERASVVSDRGDASRRSYALDRISEIQARALQPVRPPALQMLDSPPREPAASPPDRAGSQGAPGDAMAPLSSALGRSLQPQE